MCLHLRGLALRLHSLSTSCCPQGCNGSRQLVPAQHHISAARTPLHCALLRAPAARLSQSMHWAAGSPKHPYWAQGASSRPLRRIHWLGTWRWSRMHTAITGTCMQHSCTARRWGCQGTIRVGRQHLKQRDRQAQAVWERQALSLSRALQHWQGQV